MSDNVATSSGMIISADDLGAGVKVQRVKVQFGADGSATDVAAGAGNGLPVAVPAGDTAGTVLDASSARTASGAGAEWARFAKGGVFLVDVTAVSGTSPTMTVRVQQSIDGSTWFDVDTTNAQTTSITATGQKVLRVYPGLVTAANASCSSLLSYHTRLAWTIGGTTPSFTFSTWFVAHHT